MDPTVVVKNYLFFIHLSLDYNHLLFKDIFCTNFVPVFIFAQLH